MPHPVALPPFACACGATLLAASALPHTAEQSGELQPDRSVCLCERCGRAYLYRGVEEPSFTPIADDDPMFDDEVRAKLRFIRAMLRIANYKRG